ncbi:MAG: pilus assembly protein N-terminal domain-containing protein [Hyphomicrobiales bacterium]|nr:pilus assembly protein N-terminal domain-containing protein [Hyphomicrobiales bacterium]
MKMLKVLAAKTATRYAKTLLPAAIVGISLLSAPANAESTITVEADRAKIVNITGSPAAIIIGNPTFADVTVRSGKLIIHGRHFGTTNLLILDDAGDQIANFELNVVQRQVEGVVMYKAGARETYSCAPNCEVTLSVGDSDAYFSKRVSSQITGKTAAATSAAQLTK